MPDEIVKQPAPGATLDVEPSTYDSILTAAKKMVGSAEAASPRTTPAIEPPAPPAPTPAPPLLSQSLLARGHDLGMSEDEIRSAGEAGIGAAERALLRAIQKSIGQPKEQPKEQSPKLPKLWESEEEKNEYDPRVQKVLERVQANSVSYYEGQLAEMRSQLQRVTDYLQEQVAEQGRSTIDKIGDKLVEEGYTELGKGRARPGTPQHESKVKLAILLSAEQDAYQKAGMSLDLEQAARVHAERMFGKKQPGPAPALQSKNAPPKEKPTTQFGQALAESQSRTATNRPTQQNADNEPPSREKAIRAARAFYEANGNPMHDIHGEL